MGGNGKGLNDVAIVKGLRTRRKFVTHRRDIKDPYTPLRKSLALQLRADQESEMSNLDEKPIAESNFYIQRQLDARTLNRIRSSGHFGYDIRSDLTVCAALSRNKFSSLAANV